MVYLLLLVLADSGCSSRRYGAPAPNRVGNGVRTRPHAPFEDRRVRSVSATRPGVLTRCHAHGGRPTRPHAPQRSCHTASLVLEVSDFNSLALPEVSRHSGFIHGGEAGKEAEVKEEVITEVLEKDGGGHKREVQSSDTAATAVMADDDEIDVLLAASDDGKSDWMANNTANRVVGRGSVRFRMADGRSVTLTEVRHVPNLPKNLISIGMLDSKGCSFDPSGGTLRVFKENKEMLWGKKTRGLYRLEGNVQTGGVTVRHGSSGIIKENGQGKQPLHRGTQSKRRGTWGIRNSTWRILSGTRAQGDALLCAQGRRDEATPTRKVTYFAAHPGGGCGAPRWGVQGTSSYGGTRSEVVRKDNLKTSDYPPIRIMIRYSGRSQPPPSLGL
ncbi:hypothetical protein Acr_09g0005620 [Actinidia rufa]|uniref:Retrovirus-related Pol polyprotein from transposon TNT 1-94-like beta-barrel domain-containing protein n=1 Tax=Actinidia rufa TaxID=165716 RepID=A0A7J0F6Q3_9ERIC|nr:hypothetical protein Acr_09g0005620 [Actinidia rufa]